ncbi:MADS-box transcription factor PHERES 2 [Morella rubra]|uniref:MADS-box transcription factor PHERES 2 n=1 Tax=Morella rubra TaxID=262757 RepID=A0A6A1W607_9ROSI|nr:MADS-box transcription factor PHERES 2 [Morella rubra]
MGRGKLTMELINEEKSRSTSFQKRKRGLIKKAEELSTLCGVSVSMIIYGPRQGDRLLELDTCPQDRAQVDVVIDKYKTDTSLKRARGALDLSDFFIERNKRVEVEIKRLRKNIFQAKYPTWDDRIDVLTKDQLRLLLDVMDSKVESAALRINMMKGNQHVMEKSLMFGEATSGMVYSHGQPQPKLFGSHFNSAQTAFYQDQLSIANSPMKPYNNQWSSFSQLFQTDQGSHMLPLDLNPMDNNFMKLLHGDRDWTQLGTVSTSSTLHEPSDYNMLPLDLNPMDNNFMKLLHGDRDNWTQFGTASTSSTTLHEPSDYNMISGALGSTILNNPGAPFNYYDLSGQFTPQYMQYPVTPNISSHVRGFQVNELYDVKEYCDTKNVRRLI